jgi:hypothetical protein
MISIDRYRRSLQITITAAVLLGSVLSSAYALPVEKPKREERLGWWIEDLEFFARTFPAAQVDFPKLYNPARFRKEIDDLELAIPRISDSEIVLRLMGVVASGNVAHTRVYSQEDLEFHNYPLRFAWYSDGAALIRAKEEYKSALGARIMRIGSMTPEQLEAAIAPFVPHENEFWLHAMSPELMLTQEVADHFALAKPDGSIEMTFVRPGGQPFKLQIAPSAANTPLVSAAEALKLPTPLFHKRPDDYYWYEYLADSHALYIQFNSCQNDPKKPFKDFARELFGFVDSLQAPQEIERVIIDLRDNSGGNSSVIDPLLQGLRSRPRLSEPGHLYTLISKNTFSSGMMNAVELRRDLHAILIGEPSGSAPNEYGEIKNFVLPNSKIEITYATKYFRLLKDSNPSAVYPDVTVYRSTEDFLTGRDRVLETALKHAISEEKRSASK